MPRTALVAGVGPRVGDAVAREFRDAGLNVGLFARSPGHIEALAGELGDRALAVPTDVTDPDAVAEGVERVRDAFGPVEVFVHNAAAPGGHPLDEATVDSFAAVWETRALGAFLCLRELGDDLEHAVVSGTNFASEGAPDQVEWGSAAAATKGLARSAGGGDAAVVYVEIATAVAPSESDFAGATNATTVAETYRDLLDAEPGFHTRRIE